MNPHSDSGSVPYLSEAQAIRTTSLSGLILLDTALRPVATDEGATRILQPQGRSKTQSNQSLPVPPEILSYIRTRAPGDPTSATIQFGIGNQRFKCHIYRLKGEDPTVQALIAVHLESETDLTDPILEIAKEYDLTSRELEALKGIAMGLTTKELATHMGISPNTVKAFVRLIMLKLGIRNRTAIIARLLERTDGVRNEGNHEHAASTIRRPGTAGKPEPDETHIGGRPQLIRAPGAD